MYKIPLNEDLTFLIGKELIQICIGAYDLQLHFMDKISITIQGETPAKSFHHKTTLISSSEVGGMAGVAVSLVSLLGSSVHRVVVEDILTLAIFFSNKDEFRIFDSSDEYESFTIIGPNRRLVV